MILVATITLSRMARAFSQVPMMVSLRPKVSARAGKEYISAVSMKVTPAATAMSSCRWASASVFCSPNVMVPRQTRLTMMSVRPRRLYSIVSL